MRGTSNLHVLGILNPNTGGKNLYGELSVHIRAPILNSDSNVLVQYAWDVYQVERGSRENTVFFAVIRKSAKQIALEIHKHLAQRRIV